MITTKFLIAFTFVVALAPQLNAQVIYEPVKYQHGDDPVVYYGGSNPRVLAYAQRLDALYGQPRKYDAHGHELPTIRRGLTTAAPYVFTDRAGLVNASLYGYTDTDARNEAYASVPCYFRKADLLRAAVPAGDGTLRVPANARSRPLHDARVRGAAATRPSTRPAAILILPKKKPAPAAPAKNVSANGVALVN